MQIDPDSVAKSDMQVNKSTRPIIQKAAEVTNPTSPMRLSKTERERQNLNAEYKLIHAKVMAEMQIDHLEPLTTEEEILAAATRITQRK